MKLGLLTAPFPDTPLDEVADWTAAQRLRVASRSPAGRRRRGRRRRYAGTSHIDVANLSPGQADDLAGEIARQGPRHLGPRLLPEPAPSRPGPPRRRSSATSST